MERVDLIDDESVAVLLHLIGDLIKVIAHMQKARFTVDLAALVADLHLHARSGRLGGRKNNILQIQVTVGAAQIFDGETFDLYLFDEFFVERIQRVQNIHKIVLRFVRRRKIHRKKRVKAGKCLLRCRAAHLLRLVQNDNRTVARNDVDGSAALEVVQLLIDAPCVCAARIERLNVDDHHMDGA